ncbi:DUF6088 family protein [Acidobacteria bacterium AH-259-D05]|nr:DUF6088 family protein [Acidobacteria bacterium AH-259-D05]
MSEKTGIFSDKMAGKKSWQAIEQKAYGRIRGNGRGWAFSQQDFARLGSRDGVDKALQRLLRKGTIRRVIRGIYDYPQFSDLLDQQLSPDLDQVAQALARKFGWRIQPSGAAAQNLIGLSTQVPGRIVYLSDGPDRSYGVGETLLIFEHTALKEAGFKYRESALLVQALKALRPDGITPAVIEKIRASLDHSLRRKVLVDTKTATGWVYKAIQQICREESDE